MTDKTERLEPKQYIGVDDEPDFSYYTATQLAAARLQGAEDVKQLATCVPEMREEIVFLNQRITALERVNRGLLVALQGMLSLDEADHQRYSGDEDVCLEVRTARAAIAAEQLTQRSIYHDRV